VAAVEILRAVVGQAVISVDARGAEAVDAGKIGALTGVVDRFGEVAGALGGGGDSDAGRSSGRDETLLVLPAVEEDRC
jgi:hypothetical protein